MVLFKMSRLPGALKMLFRFRVENNLLLHQTMHFFYIPLCRTNIKQSALCFQGPKFFNSLNIEIQNVGTLSLSKSELRILLLLS